MNLKRFPAQMLLDYQNTVNRLVQTDPGMYMLLFKSIRQWYNDNGVRLESLKDKIKALQKEYFVMEEQNGDEQIKFTAEVRIHVPAKYETRTIPGQWYEFWAKPKTEQVKISDETVNVIPAEPVWLPEKDEKEFDAKYKALVSVHTEIKF